MKAFTLSFRGSNKDYYDLYFILKEKFCALEDIKILGEKKYGDEFNFLLSLEQLFYIEETQKEQIEFLKKEPTEKEMKDFFKRETKKIKI
ncbi:hypothetical protein FJ208_00195 [Candidatus Gribaldobacteria bacterium]|nr:hypothetical protein [Candidatus Gribaldobacteria bacterium]